jgi:hypothetical protein
VVNLNVILKIYKHFLLKPKMLLISAAIFKCISIRNMQLDRNVVVLLSDILNKKTRPVLNILKEVKLTTVVVSRNR